MCNIINLSEDELFLRKMIKKIENDFTEEELNEMYDTDKQKQDAFIDSLSLSNNIEEHFLKLWTVAKNIVSNTVMESVLFDNDYELCDSMKDKLAYICGEIIHSFSSIHEDGKPRETDLNSSCEKLYEKAKEAPDKKRILIINNMLDDALKYLSKKDFDTFTFYFEMLSLIVSFY